MKVFKLKHIPTGLFYTPSKGSGNLSKTGKIYSKKPDVKWALVLRIKIFSFKQKPTNHHKTIVDYFGLDWRNGSIDTYVKTNYEDWEIVEL
ncbi:MAG: hypothetical protein ACOC22_03715 [bacterium]